MIAKRFYFADGRFEHVEVFDEEPSVWVAREYPTWLQWNPTFLYRVGNDPLVSPLLERKFRRVDYRYPADFIGPRRDSEYHEVK